MGSALLLTVSMMLGQVAPAPGTPDSTTNTPATATPAPQPPEATEVQKLQERVNAVEARLREREAELAQTQAELERTQETAAANSTQLQTLQENTQILAQSRQGRLDDFATAGEYISSADAALTRGALDVQRALVEARNRLLRAAGEARQLGYPLEASRAEDAASDVDLASEEVEQRDGYAARQALFVAAISLNEARLAALEAVPPPGSQERVR